MRAIPCLTSDFRIAPTHRRQHAARMPRDVTPSPKFAITSAVGCGLPRFAGVQIVDRTALPDLPISAGQSTALRDPGKDYWDMGSKTAQAPPTWLEDLATADTSWVFDATGLI